MWFTEAGASRVGRITPAGAISEFKLAVGARPDGIAVGPDGAIWFTESGLDKIGRIGPEGGLTEFPLPAPPDPATPPPTTGPYLQPLEIVTGQDGGLWFSISAGNYIGRITPAGDIAWFKPDQPMTALAAAADDGVWFVADGRIGRLTSDGTFSYLGVPDLGIEHQAVGPLVPTPAGDYLFRRYGPIWKLAPDGRFSAVGGLPKNFLPLTATADGAVWGTTDGGNEITRTGGAGLARFQATTPAAGVRGLAAGPDGGMCGTEFGDGQIVRVPLSGTGARRPSRKAHARLLTRRLGRRGTIRVTFRTPPTKPRAIPLAPGEDPQGAPDGPSYYALSFTSRSRSQRCNGADQVAIVPNRRDDAYTQNQIVRDIDKPGRRITVRLHPTRGQGAFCKGRFTVSLYTAYYLVPGPGTGEIVLETLARRRGRIR
jgi:virginiamycin B lyase